MTLDEAIKHAEEVGDELFDEWNKTDNQDCFDCSMEHKQLAEWLKDYKRLLGQAEIADGDRAVSLNAAIDNAFEIDIKDGFVVNCSKY